MTTPQIPFQRNAVQPVECVKAGWELVKPHYWLFVGMALVAQLIGSAVPLGILLGPMMCGIYLAFFKHRRGEPIEFGIMFKGFDYFGPSVVATLLHMVPVLAVVLPAYVIFYLGLLFSVAAQGASREPNPGVALGVFFLFACFFIVVFSVVLIVSIGFTFSYPLIVDRNLPGFDAVKLSFRAAMANFWRLLGMTLLSGLLGAAGALLCVVGIFLVYPIIYAAVAAAYEQVFGLRNPEEVATNLPPPPPVFN